MAGKTRFAAVTVVVIAGIMGLVISGVHERSVRAIADGRKALSVALQPNAAYAGLAQPAPTPTCPGSNVTLKNQNRYPVWLGESISSGGVLAPPPGPSELGANWELLPRGSVTLCAPTNWTSGVFWARTQCNFSGTFGEDPDYKDCNSTSDCNQANHPHVCRGAKCLIDCSPDGTNGDCSALDTPEQVGTPVCVANNYCGFAGGVCKTGDCGSGLYQCQGTWDNEPLQTTPASPVSLFEMTDTASGDGNLGSANYDVSNNSGYNVPLKVDAPSAPSGAGNCISNSCVTDLNTVCPTLLQSTQTPGASGPIPCGGEFCQSGACVGGKTCVIGCNAPTTECGPAGNPNAPAGLKCGNSIPSGTLPDGRSFTADGSTYRDMYAAANTSGNVNNNDIGDAMFSGLQGTPECWGTADCPAGFTCVTGAKTGITGWPSTGVGLCMNPGPGGSVQGSNDCASSSDIGKGCGGYPNTGPYTCVAANTSVKVACVPPFNPAVAGIGPFDSTDELFEGIAGPMNGEWVAAGVLAGGGTTPYYETFTNACPHQYAWQYDDYTGGHECDVFPLAFTVTFGALTGTPTSTPGQKPTPTPTKKATATPTKKATPTPTKKATPMPTKKATATPTKKPTSTTSKKATPTPTRTRTRTPIPTRTGKATATPRKSPTPTPRPSRTPLVKCSPNIYLANPSGTIVFPAVPIGLSNTQPVTLQNDEPAGTAGRLTLTPVFSDPKEFSVGSGSTCASPLPGGSECKYNIVFAPQLPVGPRPGPGVPTTNVTVSGTFPPAVCPPGDKQSVTVNFQGYASAPTPTPTPSP